MNVTFINLELEGHIHNIAVSHECSWGEFMVDLKQATRKFLDGKTLRNQIDIFWFLEDYCTEKYEMVHWEAVTVRSLLESLKDSERQRNKALRFLTREDTKGEDTNG